jgi:hypothetical protein
VTGLLALSGVVAGRQACGIACCARWAGRQQREGGMPGAVLGWERDGEA